MSSQKLVIPILISVLIISCANMVQVKIDVVDQRTALENQVLGSYQSIGRDTMLMASVRSIDSNGRLIPAPKLPESRKRAIRAMQRSQFNRDDIEILKSIGAAGEGKDSYLKFYQTSETSDDPQFAEFAKRILDEENEDRKVLYKRIVEVNETFRSGDLAIVETIMAGLNRDAALPGELVELDSGQWINKGSN